MLKSITFTAMLSLLSLNAFANERVKLEVPGFESEAAVFPAQGAEKTVGIVLLHGKGGTPNGENYLRIADSLSAKGYKVIAPVMPWSSQKYVGTREQGLELINAAAKAVGTGKVVVVGHSMGGMAALQYAATVAAPNVAGVVAVAAGHDPNNAPKLRSVTVSGAERACSKMAEEKGKDFDGYPETNAGRDYDIHAAAEYYCTHYSTSQYPDSQSIGKAIKVQFYMISGTGDRLTQVYSHDRIFDSIPKNPKSRHDVLSGSHYTVLPNSVDAIMTWIDTL